MAWNVLSVDFLSPPGTAGPKQRIASSSRDLFLNHAGTCVREVFGVLSEAECGAWVAWAERNAFDPASHGPGGGLARRECSRFVIDDASLAGMLWARVKQYAPKVAGRCAVGCLPLIRVYRYDVGQQFAKHVDASTAAPSFSGTSSTEATMLLYLNSAGEAAGGGEAGLQGGETVFYKGKLGTKRLCAVVPHAGVAMLHTHGDRCLLHAGAKVTCGTKFLLRTDIVYDDE